MKASVLLVGNFLSSSGGTRSACEELAPRLAMSGMSVLTTSRYRQRLFRIFDMAVTCWIKRRRFDVAQVDVYSGLSFVWAEATCWALRLAGKPYILTLRGGNLPEFTRRWPRRVQRLLSSALAVTTPSNYLRESLRQYRDDLTVVPNAIDLSSYTFRLREHPLPKLVWIRAFHSIYNPMLAPRVISLLIKEFPAIQLLMIGPDKADGSLQSTQDLADKLAVLDRIELHRAVGKADIPVYLQKGDIFLNTPNIDNTPVSVIEAMANGLCIVSTSVGGIPYLLENERDALLVPPDDPQEMATAIRRILTEPRLAKYLSQNAHDKAQQFDWSKVLPRWQSLFAVNRAGEAV